MIKKIAKIVLISLGCLLGVILMFGIVLLLGWPWWTGFFLLLGVTGLALALLLVKKIWARKREQHFVSEIISQDNQQIGKLGGKDKSSLCPSLVYGHRGKRFRQDNGDKKRPYFTNLCRNNESVGHFGNKKLRLVVF